MLVAVLAGLAALALLVWYQSGGVSTRQRWRGNGRFGQLAPEPPWPRRPVDPDERFAVWPRRRLVVPAIAGAGLLLAGVALVVAGVALHREPG